MESNLAKFAQNGSSYFIKCGIDSFCHELSLSVIKTNEPFSARISKKPRTVCNASVIQCRQAFILRLRDVPRDLPLRGQLVQPAHLQHRGSAVAVEARVWRNIRHGCFGSALQNVHRQRVQLALHHI